MDSGAPIVADSTIATLPIADTVVVGDSTGSSVDDSTDSKLDDSTDSSVDDSDDSTDTTLP